MSTKLPAAGSDGVLYIVDLSGYIFRAYHAIPELSSPSGEATNATYGTINMLVRMIADRRPSHIGIAMDSKGKGLRGQIDPQYKANRPPAPPDLPPQMARCREIVLAYGMPVFSTPEYEADDQIATLTRCARDAGLKVVIASSDKDLMQLIEPDGVWMWDAMRKRVFGVAEVEEKFGVGPSKIRDFLALIGDSSDNITGVRGVGPKTAAKLLAEYGSIEGIYQHIDEIKRPKLLASLIDNRADAELALRLVELQDVPGLVFDETQLRVGGADVAKLRTLFEQLGFTRLLERLEEPPASDACGGDASDDTSAEDAVADPPPTEQSQAGGETIQTAEQLTALVDGLRQAKRIAIIALGPDSEPMRSPLTGIAIAHASGSAYLPLGHRYLGVPAQLSLDTVRQELGPLLADDTVAKVGHDLKYTQVLLACHQLAVRGAGLDTMLASYLIDPESSHKLEQLADRDAGLKLTPFESLAPRPKRGPKPTVEDIEIEILARYAMERAAGVLALSETYEAQLEDNELLALNRDLEMPLSQILTRMERYGVRIEAKPLEKLGVRMTHELARIETAAFEAAGQQFNLGSPKQLAAILFDELALASTKKTKTGRSTDAEALEAIRGDHPLPGLVLEHRAVAKLKSTYVDTLPKLIHRDTGRVHTRWEQAVAATGRLSSKEPNLQNIPIRSEHGKEIRQAFTAPEGMLILSADYSQIELRVLAHLSEDPKLTSAFKSGQDVHVRTAMEIFGVAEEEVTSEMRGQSKTVNFGVIYGMGSVALAKRLGISRKEAKSFIEAYFLRYEGVRTFMAETLERARAEGVVRTILGRRRVLRDIDSRHHGKRAYAERIAQNTPIQGSAADLLKLAMLAFDEPVVAGARMVLTVHDELVFEVPAEHIEEAIAETKSRMEGIYPMRVPLLVDIGSGNNWAEAH
jgi:DNA polymerase-1